MIRRNPNQIIVTELIDDLWSNGWTIAPVRPHPDPYHIAPEIIPRDRAYQWVSREHDLAYYKSFHWREVPAERHPGVFAPWGYVGECAIGDLILVEKPKSEVEAAHAANHAKAHKNVDDWSKGASEGGFTGGMNVWTDGDKTAMRTEIEHDGVSQTELPVEMLPHLKAILKERDRLVAEEHRLYLVKEALIGGGPAAEGGGQPARQDPYDLLACRTRCMEQAIKNIRQLVELPAPSPKEPGDEHAD